MRLEEIDLYLTNRCNLSCDFCSVRARKHSSELSLDRILTLIDEACSMGLQELHLTGGEPTLRNDLEDVVAYAVKKGLNVRLITNGTILTNERLQLLRSLGLNSIMISIDGESDYHNAVRGEGAFEKAFSTVKNAINLGMLVRVNSVAWRDNQYDILRLAERLDDIGVNIYSIFLGSPLGYAQVHKDNIISPDEWFEFYKAVREVSSGLRMKVVIEKGFLYPKEITYDLTDLQGRGRGCLNLTQNTDFLLIRSNGDVYPCVFFSNEAPPMGNVNSQLLREIIEQFEQDSFYNEMGCLPEACKECSRMEKCRGGCRGYARLYTGFWTDKDPRCTQKGIIPLCPIVKLNVSQNILGGSSEQVLR